MAEPAGGLGKGRVGQRGHAVGLGGDEVHLALVPHRQHLGVGQAADQTRVDEAGELDVGDVAAGGEEAVEVPDGLCASGKCSVRKPPPFFLLKKPLKPQRLSCPGADVEQVHDQQVTGLGALRRRRGRRGSAPWRGPRRARRRRCRCSGCSRRSSHRSRARTRRPVDPGDHRDVRVPAVVHHLVLVGGLIEVDLIRVSGMGGSFCKRWSGGWGSRRGTADARGVGVGARGLVDDAAAFDDEGRSATSSAKDSTCSETTMVISRSLRISFSALAMSLMMDGWMPSVGSSSSSTWGR